MHDHGAPELHDAPKPHESPGPRPDPPPGQAATVEAQGRRVAAALWGPGARPALLVLAAAVLLVASLGAKELWTHEGRWALIVQEMLRSGDLFHPHLLGEPYYDKPLPSYWLMAATARLLGGLDEWALRLPSALAGLLAAGATVSIGRRLWDRGTGLLAGWILLGAFFFVFWSRVASADMLNVAGIMAAVAWFLARRERPGLVTHGVLAATVAAACLMKGLIAAAVVGLVLLPCLAHSGLWRRHLTFSLLPAALVALGIYAAPFLLSGLAASGDSGWSGLQRVFEENVLRFFDPFDHKGPITLYLLYLPLYLLPWSVLLPGVVHRALRGWKELDGPSRWPLWASGLIFVFLTASGSRRSYYILPILPFLALAIAGWVREPRAGRERREAWAGILAATGTVAAAAWFAGIVPVFGAGGGLRALAPEVRREAAREAPGETWRLLAFHVVPAAAFYVQESFTGEDGATSVDRPVSCSPARVVRLLTEDDAGRLRGLLEEGSPAIVLTPRSHLSEIRPHLGKDVTRIEEPSSLPRFLSFARNPKRDVLALLVPRFHPEDS